MLETNSAGRSQQGDDVQETTQDDGFWGQSESITIEGPSDEGLAYEDTTEDIEQPACLEIEDTDRISPVYEDTSSEIKQLPVDNDDTTDHAHVSYNSIKFFNFHQFLFFTISFASQRVATLSFTSAPDVNHPLLF